MGDHKNKSFTVKCTEDEYNLLGRVSKDLKTTRSELVRTLFCIFVGIDRGYREYYDFIKCNRPELLEMITKWKKQ